ncbi:LON peptidase substrate-binding domain-containing protein, partial [Pelomicrobium sp. G1]|uniref:LON peptidase substrate-binding domain-containing protein n=1 Tax=Pelomicrobium sp. G1 TaxID=3452920 RepID=UPI003F75F9A0
MLRYVTTPDGTHHILAQGESRFRVLRFLEGWPFMVARVQRIQEEEPKSAEIEARVLQLKERTKEILELLPQVPA